MRAAGFRIISIIAFDIHRARARADPSHANLALLHVDRRRSKAKRSADPWDLDGGILQLVLTGPLGWIVTGFDKSDPAPPSALLQVAEHRDGRGLQNLAGAGLNFGHGQLTRAGTQHRVSIIEGIFALD